MKIQHFFDTRTSTLTYVVHDEASRIGVVMDSVMDFDPQSGRIWQESFEAVGAYITSCMRSQAQHGSLLDTITNLADDLYSLRAQFVSSVRLISS